jgi:transcription elongation factor SPT6
MANSMRDLIMNEAELDEDEDDESFDEETGETRERKREGHVDDSSEEEDDDDDEEEARRVRSRQLVADDLVRTRIRKTC